MKLKYISLFFGLVLICHGEASSLQSTGAQKSPACPSDSTTQTVVNHAMDDLINICNQLDDLSNNINNSSLEQLYKSQKILSFLTKLENTMRFQQQNKTFLYCALSGVPNFNREFTILSNNETDLNILLTTLYKKDVLRKSISKVKRSAEKVLFTLKAHASR